jgi:hypothetical protein
LDRPLDSPGLSTDIHPLLKVRRKSFPGGPTNRNQEGQKAGKKITPNAVGVMGFNAVLALIFILAFREERGFYF